MATFDRTNWFESLDETFDWDASADSGSASLIINQVRPEQLGDALEFILPTAGLQPQNGTFRIRRNLPAAWPYGVIGGGVAVGQMFASRVNIKPLGTFKYQKFTTGSYSFQQPYYGINTTVSYAGGFGHEYYQLKVDFLPIRHGLVSDGDIDQSTGNNAPRFIVNDPSDPAFNNVVGWPEWIRNTEIDPSPVAELLTLPGASLQFTENPDANIAPGIVTKDTPFPVPWPEIQKKCWIVLNWLRVPADFVLGTVGIPLNFIKALGTVNDAPFLGFPAETLCFIDFPEFTPHHMPIIWRQPDPASPDPSNPSYLAYLPKRPWYYDIKIKIRFFDPKRGALPTVPPNPADPLRGTHRGHNIFPPRGQNFYLFANRVPFGLPANTLSDPTRPPMWLKFDFRKMFMYQSVTDIP